MTLSSIKRKKGRQFVHKIRKQISVFLITCCIMVTGLLSYTSPLLEVRAETEEPANLYAQSAVLMDADSGRILFSKNGQQEKAMASTTKIMTCILALEYGRLDDKLTVSAYAASQPKVHLGASKGEEYFLRDLLYSLMLESHNDSAVIIAEHIGKSVEGFAEMMNAKAKELGCTSTYFITPNGLDASDENGKHRTTAEDLAKIMRYCIGDSPQSDMFLEITRTSSYQFTDCSGKRSFSCNNHNAFLQMMDGALSGKTGFTGDAGYCYVGALERDGKRFIVALLACGWPNNKSYKWSDTRTLMNYGLDHYQYQNIWQDVDPGTLKVVNGIDLQSPFEIDTEVSLVVSEEEKEWQMLLREDEAVEVKWEKDDMAEAPVTKGDKVGEVQYTLNGKLLKTFDITASASVSAKNLNWYFRTVWGMYFMKSPY